MKTPDTFSLTIASETMHVAGVSWVRHSIAVLFIGAIAVFATAPVGEAPSAYDKPLPMPADLELELEAPSASG